MLRENLFNLIERIEKIAKCLLIGRLRGGKARAINAVIDIRLDQVIEAIDFGAQVLRIIVSAHIGEVLKGRIEHADNFR